MSLEHSPARATGSTATHKKPNAGILDEFLTDEELAAELNRHKRTVERWRRLGDAPPSIRVGRQRLTHRQAVLDWLLRRQQAASA